MKNQASRGGLVNKLNTKIATAIFDEKYTFNKLKGLNGALKKDSLRGWSYKLKKATGTPQQLAFTVTKNLHKQIIEQAERLGVQATTLQRAALRAMVQRVKGVPTPAPVTKKQPAPCSCRAHGCGAAA